MQFALTEKPLSVNNVMKAVRGDDTGALVDFVGTVRGESRGHRVLRLEYEAYNAMALAFFEKLQAEAEHRWHGTRLAIHHRIGVCEVGEVTVVIAAATPHRAAAFEACRFAIEQLKAHAPIWKKEVYEDGAAWIGQGS
jgi:molybdopterin synthase catalytic subunit